MTDIIEPVSVPTSPPPVNPDAAATVSEYVDYTEYLHCDITRSLSLIHTLDQNYAKCATIVHSIASEYCSLSSANSEKTKENSNGGIAEKDVYARAICLRKGIADSLNVAIKDREESVAEAGKLYETVDRHFNRLSDIIKKLQKINVVARANSSSRLAETVSIFNKSDPQMRITLRLDSQHGSSQSHTLGRQVIPRTNMPLSRVALDRNTMTDKPLESRKYQKTIFQPKKRISSVNFTDTQNSSSLVQSAPTRYESSSESGWEDASDVPPVLTDGDRKSTLAYCYAENGEKLPWLELLPGELAVLRKRMKKNSSWQPSDAMMLKQLEMLGRGVKGFRKWAKKTNQDQNEIDRTLSGGGEGSPHGIAISALTRRHDNKGMRLNIMKRAKRERERAEAEAAAVVAARIDTSGVNIEVTNSSSGNNRSRVKVTETPNQATKVLNKSPNLTKKGLFHEGGKQYPAEIEKQIVTSENVSGQPNIDDDDNYGNLKNRRNSVQKGGRQQMADPDEEDEDDMPIDPNEPTYCLCNRISFGTMVGCDNEDCPKEWFHMECVGLKAEPSKNVKWYCPLCKDNPIGVRKDVNLKGGRKRRKIGK